MRLPICCSHCWSTNNNTKKRQRSLNKVTEHVWSFGRTDDISLRAQRHAAMNTKHQSNWGTTQYYIQWSIDSRINESIGSVDQTTAYGVGRWIQKSINWLMDPGIQGSREQGMYRSWTKEDGIWEGDRTGGLDYSFIHRVTELKQRDQHKSSNQYGP